jgi:uncharacterized membrane protein YjjB (DUF3815 family)
MDLPTLAHLLPHALWAAVLATALACIFTVPRRALPIAALGGFAGRLVRDALTGAGVDLVASAFLAAIVVTVIAVWLAPRKHLKPVVAMSALIPISASIAAFHVVREGLNLANIRPGQDAGPIAAQFAANLTTLVSVTFAIALGFMLPWSIWHHLSERREKHT